MSVMHPPENGQNGSEWPLHECAPCQCTTERHGKKKSGGNFVPSAPADRLGNKSKLTRTPSRRRGLSPPTRARQSVRPPEIKGRPRSQFGDSSSCLGRRGGSSRLKAAGQRLTALYFRPAPPKKRAPLCAGRPAASTVYRPRQRSHSAFFFCSFFSNTLSPLARHRPAVSLQQPDTRTVHRFRLGETQ